MYGLLLEGIYSYLRVVFGEETLTKVRQKANITHSGFDSFRVYSETVIPRLARAAQDVTGMPQEELMESFGVSFVSYTSRYNYDRLLKVLGRNLRDFLNNLDNLHEYLRFSYPKIKPPSFFVTDETEDGLTLHYRSKRKGFKSYLKGQIRQVGKEFYNTDIKCHELEVDDSHGIFYVKMRLSFDNSEGFANLHFVTQLCEMNMPITSSDLFRLFPFHMVLSRELVLTSVGKAILPVLPHALGCQVDDLFHLERPIMEFSWESILSHTNNIFELKSVDGIENRFEDSFDDMSVDKLSDTDISLISADQTNQNDSLNKYLTLRGQMLHMEQWNAILFLGTPVLENLDHMFKLGLYINDLSIHDSSRELVLAGTQQSAELKLLLDQEQTKSKKLEESMRKLDIEIKRTDQLLYQMIPKSVANRLRAGEPSVNTCEVFDICTILFSDVVGFTTICSAISPMEVVNLLNGMYTTFDTLIEKFQLYKVETIGDAYMIAGGIPKPCDKHASSIAEMAFAMLNAMKTLKDPSDETDTGAHLKLRVGIHSGTVVGGVVGLKMPRYCLFGDTVNTANRMESTGQAMRVHCSQSVKNCLDGNKQYSFEQRGSIEIKGKGLMTTYWLNQHEFNTLQHSDSLIKHILAEPPIIDVCNPSTFPNLLDVRSIKSDGPGMRSSETKSSGEYSPNAKCVAFKVPDTTKKDKTFAKEPVVCQNEALNEEGSVGFSFVSDSDRADDKNSSSVKSSLILSDSNLPPTLTEYVSPPSASKSSPTLAKCGRPSAVRGHNSPLNVKEHNSPLSSHSRNMVAVEPVFTHFSTSSNKPVLPSYGVQKKLANHRPTVSVVDSKDTTCSTTCILL